MKDQYRPAEFEKKWQAHWFNDGIYSSNVNADGERCFVVDMFPYPSGASMHVGHPRGYVATDVYSRYKRMLGFRVLHPMGWDAFGLPAEETAIANQEHPRETVTRNISRFKSQLIALGLGFDWNHEINTTDPAYYKNTQLIFLELFRSGLTFYETRSVNWCQALGTVLANEDIVEGRSERGGHPVEQRPMQQWNLSITKYADRLLEDLNLLSDWPDRIKNAQSNWIGRSVGHDVVFSTSIDYNISVYTTRLETLGGVTFIALAPDSAYCSDISKFARNTEQVENYIEDVKNRSDRERQINRDKSGVLVEGVYAINSVTGENVRIYIADYVLAGYGSGAVMGVPAHDDRDEEFAKMMDLPIIKVVEGTKLINSGNFTGLDIEQSRIELANHVGASEQVRYKMRDWVFSRQRFWGEPFPIIWIEGSDSYNKIVKGPIGEWLPESPITYIEDDQTYFAVPIIPSQLDSAKLPEVENYAPTGELSGPLAKLTEWVNVYIDPKSGKVTNKHDSCDELVTGRRETSTMPQWAGSSWYWLRYMDPANSDRPFSKQSAKEWGPVNVYAGADHAVAHLIYARFWHKVLFDAGYVDFPEPFLRLEFLGYILAEDGTKVSKRSENSRSPDEVIEEVSADAFRLYEMAIGPFEKAAPWIDANLVGTKRFLDTLWRSAHRIVTDKSTFSDPEVSKIIAKATAKVSSDIEQFKFNTAISALNICLNNLEKLTVSINDFSKFLQILAPFAPHITEELWQEIDFPYSIHHSKWPVPDAGELFDEIIVLPVQINGKKRSELAVAPDATESEVRALCLQDPKIEKWIAKHEIRKVIYVPGKILNLVVA